jgi:hypothetical protein
MQYRKNPETGKKLSVISPESDWIHVPIPELQIVDDATFDAVQAMLDECSSKAAEYRATAKLRDPVETDAIAKSRIRDWRERQIKTTGKVAAVFGGRLKCASSRHQNGRALGGPLFLQAPSMRQPFGPLCRPDGSRAGGNVAA